MHQLVYPTSQHVLQIFDVMPKPSQVVFDPLETLFGQRIPLPWSERPHNDTIMTSS